MPGQFYRAPIDPGYDRGPAVGLMQGAAQGMQLYRQGQQQRRAQEREDEDRLRAREMQDLEIGPEVDDAQAFTVRRRPAVMAPELDRIPGERNPFTGERNEGVQPQAEVSPATEERVLNPNMVRVGGRYRDLSRGLNVRRAAALGVAEREQESLGRDRKFQDTERMALAAGETPTRARELALHAAAGAPIRETPEDAAARRRAILEEEEPYREERGEEQMARTLAAIAARDNSGSNTAGRAIEKATRSEHRTRAREAAERLLRQNRTANVHSATNLLLERGRGHLEYLTVEELRDIASDAEWSVRGTRSTQGRGDGVRSSTTAPAAPAGARPAAPARTGDTTGNARGLPRPTHSVPAGTTYTSVLQVLEDHPDLRPLPDDDEATRVSKMDRANRLRGRPRAARRQ
jgi:hypothetical protein